MSDLVMLHMNGPDGAQSIQDLGGHPVEFGGTTRLTTGDKKFGSASLQFSDSPDSYLDITPVDPRFNELMIGPGHPDYSMEFFVKWPVVPTQQQVLVSIGTREEPETDGDNEEKHYELLWNPVSGGSIQLERNSRNDSAFTLHTLESGWTPTADVWYWFVLARERTTTGAWFRDGDDKNNISVASIFLTPLSGDRYKLRLGNDYNGDRPFLGLMDEFRFSNHSSFYDPSLSTLPVPTGELLPLDLPGADESIFASPLVDKGTLPASQFDLWEPSQWLRANWISQIKNSIAFNTRVKQPKTQTEKRTQLLDRPYRTFQIRLTSMNQEETHHLGNQMLRWGMAKTLLPLFSDYTTLNAVASSGQPILDCDVTDRRFFVGQYVLISEPTSNTEMETTEIGTILSFAGGITLDANLTNSFKKNARVYPLAECKISTNQQTSVVTGHHSQGNFEFTELEGRTALPRLIALDAIPAGVDAYQSYPIWKWEFQKSRDFVAAPSQETSLARATHIETFGPRPKQGTTGQLRFLDRAEAFEFMRFFHGRGGRTCPFWFPSNFSEYKLVDIPTTTSVEVSIVGEEVDWDQRPFFMFGLKDGTRIVRQISGVVRGIVDVLQFIDPLPAFNVSDVKWMARAGLSRFDKDELEESWKVEGAMETAVEILETLDERLLNAGIEYFPTTPNEVLTSRFDVVPEDCENSDEADDPRLDNTPGLDGIGG